jgi:isoquinoline 1-oxidoreductase beta subunit
MPTRAHGPITPPAETTAAERPAYGVIEAADLSAASRRRFLQAGAFMFGFAALGHAGKAFAQSQGEEPSLRAITPGGPDSGAAFDGFAPGGFIRIPRTGKITFIIPSTEMGQGIYTGEAMMLAEELEVTLDQVEIMAAPANEKLYSQPILKSQATGGSTSTRGAWGPLRQAGAAARTMLIGAAAQRWHVAPDVCFADQGRVYCRTNGQSLPYGELVAAVAQQPVPQNVPLKQPGQFKLIGRSLPRVDTPGKVNGTAQFGIDVKVAGMKIAALEICPVPGGRLAGVEDRGARNVPGVVDVLRIDNAVAVVADHYWAAKKGLEALDLRWDFGGREIVSTDRIMADLRKAAGGGKPVMGRTVGDVDKAMGDAHSRIEATYELPFLAHATMEPINTTVHVRPDACEIWVGTQAPTSAQAAAAKVLGVPPERVIINNHLIGGGFGRRLVAESITQAVQFARQVPYPLKVIHSREQDIQHDLFRPMYHDRIAAGLDANGLPVVLTDRITGGSVLGSYLPTGLPDGTLDSDAIEGAAETPYAIPTVRVDWIRRDPPVKVNWWRGVGPAHNVFVVESFIDECAHAAGRDPVEYRRALLKDNPRSRKVLEIAARKAGWGKPLPPRTARGISLHDSFGSHLALVCEVHVTPAGEVQLRKLVAAIDCGQAINPNSIEAQIEGGVVFGLSAALFNAITLTKGRVDQSNFNDYRQIRMNEVPPFEVHIVKSTADPGGVGEAGTVSAAPALGNAIFAATGIRLRQLPFAAVELMEKNADKSVIGVPTAAAVGIAAIAGAKFALDADAPGDEA